MVGPAAVPAPSRLPSVKPASPALGPTALLAASALLAACVPTSAAAQAQSRPDAGPAASDTVAPAPDPPFPAPLSSPLEPRTRLAPVHAEREERSGWIGLVDLGEAFPFHLAGARNATARDGPRPPRLLGEVAGGAFSRFDLEEHGNEFVEVHFRVGLRLRGRWRGLDARLELHHVSSHLGDEFVERTGRTPVSTSREGVELLVGAEPGPDTRIYGGPGYVLRSTAGLDPATGRLGAEWRPDRPRWGPFRPYASAEAFAWEETGWEPTLSAEAGLAFAGRYRVAVLLGAGPTRAEQFLPADERLWGLSFSADF